MKDIIITSQKIKRERNIYLICFLLSFAINIIATLSIHVRGIEIFTQLGYVLVISFFIYFILWIPAYTHYRVTSSPSKKEVTALRFLKID